MIELSRAIELVKQRYPQFLISNIGTITGGWLFGFTGMNGEKVYIPPVFVSEDNGNLSSFHPIDHVEEMETYVPVEF